MPHEFFSSTYSQARDRFREAAIKASATVDELELDASGPNNEKLTINIAWLGAEKPEQVLLHTSGLHGVEGFAGSAIQAQLLKHPPQLSDTDALVVVHGINAYGMAWLRRFNESNVDLNRNFLAPTERYKGAPDGYHKVNALLNPQSPPKAFDLFYVRLPWYILRYGFSNLKQAVAGGQYHYPNGLFFGGHELEQGPRLLLDWLKRELAGVKRIGAIDVHTGLGKYGVDSLLVFYGPESERFKLLQERLGKRVTTHDPGSVAYRVKGSFLEALGREMPQVDWICILQEFGTLHVLRVLKALREENRWHHYGRKEQLGHPAKQFNLYWKAADGTGQVERLTTSPNFQLPSSFSPDGKRLVFYEQKEPYDIGVLSMEGERTSKPLLQTEFDEMRPAISSDGRWIAYMSNETGRREIYVRPFPNVEDAKWQISTDGGVSPVWAANGRELFYRNGEAMMVVNIESEPSFRHGRPQVLFTGSYAFAARNYDISPDGQRFLMIKTGGQTGETRQELIIVQNWFEELKRLVPTGE